MTIESVSNVELAARARRRRSLAWLLPVPTYALILALVILPLFVMAWISVRPNGSDSFTLERYGRLFDGTLYLSVMLRTLWSAGLAAAVTVVLAVPAAWVLSRMRSKWRTFALSLVVVPYLTSYLLLIYSMFVVLGPGSPIVIMLQRLHILGENDSILYTPWATVIIFAYESLAIAIFVIYAVSERVTRDHLEAAASLGAASFSRFRFIIAPQLSPGLISAFLIIIVPMGGAFAESDILGGPNGQLAGNVINYQMNTAGDESMAAALSIVLLVVLIIAVGVVYGCFTAIRALRRGQHYG